MLERQNALADRDTTRVTTQNAMNGIKGITDDMSFEKAWDIIKDDGFEEGIRLMPIYTYFMKRGYSGDEIENMTLRQIEEYLENRAMEQVEG